MSKEYLSILGQTEQNEMDIVRGKSKELRFSFTDKQISALQSLNAENMKTLGFYDLAIEAERILMEQQIKRFKLDKTYTEELGIQLNLQQSLKEYKTIFDTAKTAANLSTELANLRGSWVDIKDAELSLLEVEYKEMMALGDQNELVKTLTTSIYERKKAELEAAKAMDFSTLSNIGTQKYALQVTQDIVKSYEDFTKNIIEYGSSAVSGFFNNLTDGSTKAKDALNNMAKSFGQNIANMLVQMGLLIIKQQILKALGYDTTKTSKTGTEAAGQLALNAALAAQAIIVATLTAEYWALAAAKAAANVGGVSGGVSGTMTNYLFGGGESSVVGTRGGGGSESFGSGRNGRTTINYYQTTVLANDAKSFDDMVRRNPGSIIRVVNKDLRNAGSTRTQMKGSW